MADTSGGARTTWLIEHFEPGATREVLHARLRDLATAADRSADAVVVVASVVIPADEQALCLVEAERARTVRAVCQESRLRPDRLTRVEPVRPG